MALKPCKECKTPVSEWAKKCPQCGISNPSVGPKEMAIGLAVLVAIVIIFAAWLGGSSDEKKSESATTADAKKEDTAHEEIKQALCIANPEEIMKPAVLKKMKAGESLGVIVRYSLDTPQIHVDKRLYDQLPHKSQAGLTAELSTWSLCYAENKSPNGLVGIVDVSTQELIAFHNIDGLKFK